MESVFLNAFKLETEERVTKPRSEQTPVDLENSNPSVR